MTLYYKYTSLPIIYASKILTSIFHAQDAIEHQVYLHGADARLNMDNTGSQRFYSQGREGQVPNGVDIEVTNIKPYAITWGEMEDLSWGLAVWCHTNLCEFEFGVPSGTRIGRGRVYSA